MLGDLGVLPLLLLYEPNSHNLNTARLDCMFLLLMNHAIVCVVISNCRERTSAHLLNMIFLLLAL